MRSLVKTEDDTSVAGTPPPGPLERILRRSGRHRHADGAVAVLLALADILLVVAILVLGSDGIFTAGWMGDPGMMDSTGQSFQDDCVTFLLRCEAVTVGLAVTCRLWLTAATQFALLTTGAIFIGSLATYWNP